MRRHVQFFVGICRADFHQTLIRVLFFSRLESKPTEQRKFNLIPIDQFFVADPENLTAGCIYLSRGRCQIFMVRDKKLIDWHQFESPRCLACCFRQKLVDNTKVNIFENRLRGGIQTKTKRLLMGIPIKEIVCMYVLLGTKNLWFLYNKTPAFFMAIPIKDFRKYVCMS